MKIQIYVQYIPFYKASVLRPTDDGSWHQSDPSWMDYNPAQPCPDYANRYCLDLLDWD